MTRNGEIQLNVKESTKSGLTGFYRKHDIYTKWTKDNLIPSVTSSHRTNSRKVSVSTTSNTLRYLSRLRA
jgi:hypothetical protein